MLNGECCRVFRQRPGLDIFLASASPRRRKFLSDMGLSFQLMPADAEPPPAAGEKPDEHARRACLAKGFSALEKLGGRPALVLAADTVVGVDGKILGKPAGPEDALDMLRLLNGRSHDVFSAFCLLGPENWQPGNAAACPRSAGKAILHVETDRARVFFGKWPDSVLKGYAFCGEPLDKAGAYAVQGRGSFLIERIDGNWTTVVGLPLATLIRALLALGAIMPAGTGRT